MDTSTFTAGDGSKKRPRDEDSIHSDSSKSDMYATLTTLEVAKKIKNNEFIIQSVSARSQVWKTFGNVCDLKGVEVGFVACITCKTSYKYNHKSSGTSTISKHKCNISKNQTLLVARKFKTVSISGKSPPINEVKDEIIASCVNLCCEDLRPFDSVAGKGFIDLLQKVSSKINAY